MIDILNKPHFIFILGDLVKAKWRNLKTTYTKVKSNAKTVSGAAADNPKLPATWKFFKNMLFLKEAQTLSDPA